MRGIKRAAFNPAMTYFGILDQVILISVGRRCEPVSFQDRLPVPLDEIQIAAGPPVVRLTDDIQRSGVGARPRVRIVLEPRNQRRALRNLVRDLSILPLKFLKEIEPCPRRCKVPKRVNCEARPQRIAPKEPGKPRPLAFPRGANPRQ